MLTFRNTRDLDLDEVRDLYRDSTLGERRPVDDADRMAAMLANAQLVVTAWDGPLLVGIARSISDGVWVTYLCDLAVRAAYQRQGIGRRLLAETRARVDPRCRLILNAAPAAVDYYPRIGMRQHPQCYVLGSEDGLV